MALDRKATTSLSPVDYICMQNDFISWRKIIKTFELIRFYGYSKESENLTVYARLRGNFHLRTVSDALCYIIRNLPMTLDIIAWHMLLWNSPNCSPPWVSWRLGNWPALPGRRFPPHIQSVATLAMYTARSGFWTTIIIINYLRQHAASTCCKTDH